MHVVMSCCICCSYCLLFCSLSRSSYIFSVHLSVPMVVVTTASILLKCYHWFGWCTSIHRHHCHWNNLCVLCIVFLFLFVFHVAMCVLVLCCVACCCLLSFVSIVNVWLASSVQSLCHQPHLLWRLLFVYCPPHPLTAHRSHVVGRAVW